MLMLASTYEWLWRNGVGIVPLALMVAVLCRVAPMKASTRHSLWLVVLLGLLVPPFGPAVDLRSLAGGETVEEQAGAKAAGAGAEESERGPVNTGESSSGEREDAVEKVVESKAVEAEGLKPATAMPVAAELPVVAGIVDSFGVPTIAGSEEPASACEETWWDGGAEACETGQTEDPLFQPMAVMRTAYGWGHDDPADSTECEVREAGEWSEVPAREADDALIGGEREAVEAWNEQPACDDLGAMGAGSAGDSEAETGPSAEAVRGENEMSREGDSTAAVAGEAEHAGSARGMRDYVSAVAGQVVVIRDAVMGIPPLPAAIWLAGSAALLAVMGLNVWRYRILVRDGERGDAGVEMLVREAKRAIGLRMVVEVVMVREAITPMIWCGRRVRLVLPRGLWGQLDEAGKRGVVLHELAHLARRDHWVCRLSMVLSVVYWWHPLVWLCHHRLREEADLSCDTWVTAALPRARRAYAQALLATRTYISGTRQLIPTMGLGATTPRAKRFARRLTMVMTNTNKPRLSMLGAAASVMLGCAAWLAAPLWACPPEESEEGDCAPQAEAVTIEPGQLRVRVLAPKAQIPHVPQAPRAMRVPGAVAVPMPPMPSAPGTTYEQFMRDRASDGSMGAMGGNLEERMNSLERRLDELAAQLDRLLGASGQGGAPGVSGAAPRPEQMERRRALAQEYAAAAGEMARAQELMRARAGHGQGSQGGVAFAPRMVQSGEKYWRTYELSEGKLGALVELMSREDVPVLIRGGEGAIEVEATEAQHGVFGAFVEMIEPGRGGSASHSGVGHSGSWGGMNEADGTMWAEALERYAGDAAEWQQAAAAMKDAMKQGATKGARPDVTKLKQKAKKLAEQSALLEEQAEELEARADELEAAAEELEDEDSARESLMQEMEQLAAESERLSAESEAIGRQAEELEEQAEAIEEAAEAEAEAAEASGLR